MTIIGGGVVGLMCAYELVQAGRTVRIIDKGDWSDGTSFGNAGFLSPFDKKPLSNPGILAKTLKLMLQGKSPFILHPSLDTKIAKWLLKFLQNANHERLKKTIALFEKYGGKSIELYEEMIQKHGLDFDFHHDGSLSVFSDTIAFENACASMQDPSKYAILSRIQTQELVPFLKDNIAGSVMLKRNAHLNPKLVVENLKKYLQDNGVEFIPNEEIIDFEFSGSRLVNIKSKTEQYKSDSFILATGAQVALAKKAGVGLMLTPAKGYSITFEMEEALKPKMVAMFADLFIIATPRANDVRITSKLEIGSSDPRVVQKHIDSIVNNLREYSVDFEMKNPKYWTGFRPLTPNDMPLFGRDEKYKNLIYATGLGWLGMTFSPAVGNIIARLITQEQENIHNDDILLFSGFYQG